MEVDEERKEEIDDQMLEDEQSQIEDKYTMQYFGFLPQFFMNGIYNMMCEYLQEATEALNEIIFNKFKEHITVNQLEEVSNELRIKAIQRLDAKFDKAENYLINNVFKLPDHVVLPEDSVQTESPCTQEVMAKLDQDIQNTLQKISMVKMVNTVIRTRIEKIDTLQKEFDSTLETVKSKHSEVYLQSNNVLKAATDLGNVQRELLKIERNLK